MSDTKSAIKDRIGDLPTDPMKLTDTQLKALKPKLTRYDRNIGNGLSLRVAPTGKIAFRYTYPIGGGKQRVITVGTYPAATLAHLRGEYLRLAGEVSTGIDPAKATIKKAAKVRKKKQKKHAKAAKVKASMNCAELADLFLKHIENPKNMSSRKRPWSANTIKSYKVHINNYFEPEFGNVFVDDLETEIISKWLKGISDGGKGYQSNRILGTLRVMFGWACDPDYGHVKINPMTGIKKKGVEISKSRALDFNEETGLVDDIGEIRTFWNGMEHRNPLHRLALQLMLLTGQRPNETISAKWSHLPDGKKVWVLPASITKNRKRHTIPLTPRLVEHIEAIRELSGHTEYLFPSSSYDEGELYIHAHKGCAERSNLNKITQTCFPTLERFTPHDLRRTISTHLIALNTSEFEIGGLLNHSFTGVTGVYAKGTNLKGMRKILKKWHKRLDVILSQDKQ